MTSTDMIKDMLEIQKAYDEEVSKKHNVDYVSKAQLESALFDELGELMHAQKADWCWWKKAQAPVDDKKVLCELVDVWHFVLSYQNNFNVKNGILNSLMFNRNSNEIIYLLLIDEYKLSEALTDLATLNIDKMERLVAISEYLGFTIEDVYQAYCDKNKVNYKRLKEGYNIWKRLFKCH